MKPPQAPFSGVIAPHPGFTQAQAQAIAIDYGIRGGRGSRRAASAALLTARAGLKPVPTTTIRVRRALLFYALKRLGLDVAADARPPNEQHIVLVNWDEVSAAMGRREEV
jgi:hypothetical protein